MLYVTVSLRAQSSRVSTNCKITRGVGFLSDTLLIDYFHSLDVHPKTYYEEGNWIVSIFNANRQTCVYMREFNERRTYMCTFNQIIYKNPMILL